MGDFGCIYFFLAYNATMTASFSNRKHKGDAIPHIDYALARRSVLRDFRRGMLTTLDVCDAHPELIRVATNFGKSTDRDCPICADSDVRSALLEVNYLYGDGLKGKNGRAVTEYNQLKEAQASGKSFHNYLVEVCIECRWNFLIRRQDHDV